MTFKIYQGKRVAYLKSHEYKTDQLFRLFSTRSARYFVDYIGNVYRQDKKSRKMTKMTTSKSTPRRKRPSVKIHVNGSTRRFYIDTLMARAIFPSLMEIKPSKVGHFDGDQSNNDISNIYYDMTPDSVDEVVKRI